jgi:hypothetical protein
MYVLAMCCVVCVCVCARAVACLAACFPARYFAAASLYLGASVKINPGPDFKFPPDGYEMGLVRPLSQAPLETTTL